MEHIFKHKYITVLNARILKSFIPDDENLVLFFLRKNQFHFIPVHYEKDNILSQSIFIVNIVKDKFILFCYKFLSQWKYKIIQWRFVITFLSISMKICSALLRFSNTLWLNNTYPWAKLIFKQYSISLTEIFHFRSRIRWENSHRDGMGKNCGGGAGFVGASSNPSACNE